MELSKAYDPAQAEKTHYKRWEDSGFFTPEINKNPEAGKYSIVIPPPNVTGSLHMGHALQHTIMDVLTRRKRMMGYRTLFVPGVDHAGISTQLMVTRQLKEEGKTPLEIGREAFLEKVWAWKDKYGGRITEQIRREGVSVDWTRERFTMEDDLVELVTKVFVSLYNEGAIYRGARIVNWCPNDETVLSDLEVEDREKKDGKLYFLKYPVTGTDATVTVATTRPETMLGDTAVAVNPSDERYRDLLGKSIDLPLTGRTIPIVSDEYVDSEFGTGAVKITPAHDPNDYELGQRHDLPQLNVMNKDATMNADAGPDFEGLDRYKARKLVIEKFEELGLLEKIDDYEMSLPVCERCKTVIETLVSEQWWVSMSEMRGLALGLKQSKDYPRFTPQNPHTKVYTDWLENLRDWTISRQLWWGHRIPAWYNGDGKPFVANTFEEAKEMAGTSDLTQDPDVLDTWFSSWLWSFSTLGFKIDGAESGGSGDAERSDLNTQHSDLETFHPTDVLVTARDIIFLWVSRMVMSSMKFLGERPFDDVYITGTVLAPDGQRMSKTKGNGIDPLDVFDKYGVDATRMTLAGSSTGMDFAWRDEKVESYRNFANKIWNATRFCLMNSEGAKIDPGLLENGEDLADRWIISKLNSTAIEVNRALDKYAFHEAVQTLYHFFWDDFCDWYIELSKDEITGGNSEASSRILTILEQALRMLHPFMPYLTEELWQKLPGASNALHNPAYSGVDPTVMLADFPIGDAALVDKTAESEMSFVIELISKIRNIRAEMRIKNSEPLAVSIACDEESEGIFEANESRILKLTRAGSLEIGRSLDVPKASAKGVLTSGAEIGIPLEGLIDFEKEIERLEAQINKLAKEGDMLGKQLGNENFVKKAPAEKVAAVRERSEEIETQLKALNENLETLK
ncbi:MAG: valine--tRNA ligase [Pyrinomonadaceae bacterium]|nr:valine--tRNA ligase [Pyrinomonadaceae bacterium]